MIDWFHLKLFITQMSGFDRDTLHIFAGVLVQLCVAALPRQSLARPWPWLAVLAVALANEWYDLHHEVWPELARQRMESIKDMLSTMAIPTMLAMIARFAPAVMVGRAEQSGKV